MKNFKNWLEDDRKLGPPLKTEESHVPIFRAVHHSVKTFKDMDYITLNRKWAIGHADHQEAVTEEPAVVLRALVKKEFIFEAYNPGEYFYHGPEIPGRVIYATN